MIFFSVDNFYVYEAEPSEALSVGFTVSNNTELWHPKGPHILFDVLIGTKRFAGKEWFSYAYVLAT